MTWGSQPRGQIYNNTVFTGKGDECKPWPSAAARLRRAQQHLRGPHDGEIISAGGGSFQQLLLATNGQPASAGCGQSGGLAKSVGPEKTSGPRSALLRSQFRRPGGGPDIDCPAKLRLLEAYDYGRPRRWWARG